MKETVVYILGAGFSAPLGLPVMSNFLEKSKDLYFGNTDKYAHFKAIFDKISKMSVSKNYYNTDLFNIEEILSILEMDAFFDDNSERDIFRKYIIDVIEHYTPKVEYNRPLPSNWWVEMFGSGHVYKRYGYFVSSLFNFEFFLSEGNRHGVAERDFYVEKNRDHKVQYAVISLNYDLVLENMLSHISSIFGRKSGVFFNKDAPFDETLGTPLYKLHGCVETGLIVPPTWAKGTERKIKPVWKNAHSVLLNANHIRFIGYSLPVADSYIKYLLKSAVLHSDHLKSIDVICMDGDGEVSKRYREFVTFNNFRFAPSDTAGYLDQIASFVQSQSSRASKASSFKMDGLERAHNEFMREMSHR